LPVDVTVNGKDIRLNPTTGWQRMEVEEKETNRLMVDPNYYVGSFDLLGE
jgi:hypothetical protein